MALTPLDFPASPTVGQLYPDPPVTGQPTYRWDGAQWLSYAAASLPTPTKPANYGKKNYIINGAMMVSQENGATPIAAGYPADQWFANAGTTGTFGSGQIASRTPGGSPNRIRATAIAADTSIAGGELAQIIQTIEGLRSADLMFGTTAAKTVTIQFGCKGPAGTYCVSINNAATTRAYVAEFTIAAGEANVDVVKSVTIPGDQAGTWASDNTIGLIVKWLLMGGTNFQTTPNTWTVATSGYFCTSNQFNFMGTAGNIFELFDVSLTEGSVAPPFQVPDYASELLACQRYFYRRDYTPSAIIGNLQAFTANNASGPLFDFPVRMRSSPTVTSGAVASFGLMNQVGTTLGATTAAFPVSVDCVNAGIGVAGTLAVGNSTLLLSTAASACFIQINARL